MFSKVVLFGVWCAPLVIMIFLVTACSQISKNVFESKPSEGIIKYSITFPEVSDESITASLLPDQMTYAFTPTSFASNFETAGGVFRNKIVANRDARTVDHQLKVFRKKIQTKMRETDVNQMLAEYPKAAIIRTNQTDTIAGYFCKKALIVFEDMDIKEIEVYYTDQIKMESPNWCTQYHEIEGVLMAYEIEEFGIRMRLEAEEVKTPLENLDALQAEAEYSEITREMMDIELEQLVETFEL
ncbi:hypothetical protein O3Q51_15195 [Cryomorphaceae bacterium 1068]|nr:hypothetical protein [Cryomorphaceae bacterium 1068]